MIKKQRIAVLEKRVAELEAEIALLKAQQYPMPYPLPIPAPWPQPYKTITWPDTGHPPDPWPYKIWCYVTNSEGTTQ